MKKLTLLFLLVILCGRMTAADRVTVFVGQSTVLNFPEPVKRVSIANTDIADASVTSTSQLLINGKEAGVTSLVVWNEQEQVQQYRLQVQKERSSYQVNLQVRFLEVNKSNLKEFGVDMLSKGIKVGSEAIHLGSYGGKVNSPTDPLTLGDAVDFFVNVPTQNLSAIIKALEDQSLLTVLARPNLSVIDGAEASFLAGGRFPIPIASGSGGQQTVTIQFEEYGIKLRFTPTVLDSEMIHLKVVAEVSSLDFANGIMLSGFSIPNISSRRTESTVELRQGQYLVIGGLLSSEMSKSISKIPFLGSVPVLGKLFSSSHFTRKESELLVMAAPSIVQAGDVHDAVFTRTIQP